MQIHDLRILIVTDVADDAAMVRGLLEREFGGIEVCTLPDQYPAQFERQQTQVLILACKTVEESERQYEKVIDRSGVAFPPPHRSILLCGKDDIRRAYELCRSEFFDDYVLFWPLAHDGARLLMAMHHARRTLAHQRTAAALMRLSAQASGIASLEGHLEQQLSLGAAHCEDATRSLQPVKENAEAVMDDFSRQMATTGFGDVGEVPDDTRVRREVGRWYEEVIQPPLDRAAQAVDQVQTWIGSIKSELAGPLDAARAIAESSQRARPLLLVVDDDTFLRMILSRMLAAADYEVEAVASVGELTALLRRRQPALILMDIMLPEVDGIEMTRRLKAAAPYASIPVIMITGQSDRETVVRSRSAGACDFVVKPFERDVLLSKIARHLGR